MMTPEQRYFFDLTGYLHLEGVLQGEELKKVQAAAQHYIDTPPDEVPDGFKIDNERDHFNWYLHAFAFDKALEALAFHPQTWPIIRELTSGRPRLSGGNMMVDGPGRPFHPLHSGREGVRRRGSTDARHYFVLNGKIHCNDLVFFFYLNDVHPGDGGLIVVPCSHKESFLRPRELFYPGSYLEDGGYNDDYASAEVPPGVVNITPKAGDVVVISELLTHGALTWQPKDRERRFLTLRYKQQHIVPDLELPEDVLAKLSPETHELVATLPITEIKAIAEQDVVHLS